MKEITIEGRKLYLLPVIHGLVGEEEKVKKAFEDFSPDCIAIGISPEDIEIMGKIDDTEEYEISFQHQCYLMHLSNYGKISLPPLDIKVAYELAKKNKIPILAIDINDDEYADLLTQNVSIFSLIRHSRKIKKLAKKKFKAKNAKEFVMEWDREINSIKAFRKIEEIREERMTHNLIKLCKNYKKILAIIPFEKYDGIRKRLEDM